MKPLKLATLLALNLLLTGAGCQTAPKETRIYDGNSVSASIQRLQDGETISCTDKLFDRFICLKAVDFDGLLNKLDSCE